MVLLRFFTPDFFEKYQSLGWRVERALFSVSAEAAFRILEEALQSARLSLNRQLQSPKPHGVRRLGRTIDSIQSISDDIHVAIQNQADLTIDDRDPKYSVAPDDRDVPVFRHRVVWLLAPLLFNRQFTAVYCPACNCEYSSSPGQTFIGVPPKKPPYPYDPLTGKRLVCRRRHELFLYANPMDWMG